MALRAVCDAVCEITGLEPELRNPTMCCWTGARSAACLRKADTGRTSWNGMVIGIGVNVNARAEDFAPEIRDRAGSLLISSGRAVDRARLLRRILERLDDCYLAAEGRLVPTLGMRKSRGFAPSPAGGRESPPAPHNYIVLCLEEMQDVLHPHCPSPARRETGSVLEPIYSQNKSAPVHKGKHYAGSPARSAIRTPIAKACRRTSGKCSSRCRFLSVSEKRSAMYLE